MTSEHQDPDAEAIGALLSTIQQNDAVEAGLPSGTARPPSKEALEALAKKLKDLIGVDVPIPGQQVFNSEGLPIIDITEPVANSYANNFSIPSITEEPAVLPLPKNEEERIRRRKERDAFLDALEAEEREEEEREKRVEGITGEEENGEESAFMKAVRIARERTEEMKTGMNTQANASSSQHLDDDYSDSEDESVNRNAVANNSKPKKGVSFATDTKEVEDTGDIRTGKLNQPLVGPRNGDGIMKLEIVERFPPLPRKVTISTREKDSDDEEDEEEEKHEEDNGHRDSDDDEDSNLDEEAEEQFPDEEADEEVDMSDALHQREIALRYHQLRQALGTGPEGGALGGPVDARRDAWDQEEVPLDASLGSTSKSAEAQFGGPRLASNAINAVLPKGLSGELHQEVPNEEEGETDLEISERGKRIIEGLKKGLTVEEIMKSEPVTQEEMEHRRALQPSSLKQGSAVLGDVKEKTEGEIKTTISTNKSGKVSKFKANRLGQ